MCTSIFCCHIVVFSGLHDWSTAETSFPEGGHVPLIYVEPVGTHAFYFAWNALDEPITCLHFFSHSSFIGSPYIYLSHDAYLFYSGIQKNMFVLLIWKLSVSINHNTGFSSDFCLVLYLKHLFLDGFFISSSNNMLILSYQIISLCTSSCL